MYAAFVKLLNMSTAAGILIPVVAALRFLLRKIPKKYICILWALVGLRLVFPFSFSSPVSAYNYIGSQDQSSGQVEYVHYNGKSEKPMAEVSIVLPVEETQDGPAARFVTMDAYIPTLAGLWAAGCASLLIYAAVSYWQVRMQVRESIRLRKNIYLCDHLPSPFILGIVCPRIYLPSELDREQQCTVIAHEMAHISRLDHLWKPLGYALLCVHWFNPLVWLAYALLCRDIEMACDEKVIARMTPERKQQYASLLLSCSIPHHAISACPLAFGEGNVKERVRGILNYRKPTFWIIAVSVVLCLSLAVGFLSDPLRTEDYIALRSSRNHSRASYVRDFRVNLSREIQVYAELWAAGECKYSVPLAIPETVKKLHVRMSEERRDRVLSGYRVQIDAEPGNISLDTTIALPLGSRLMDLNKWTGAKDIALTPEHEILLDSAIFDIGSGGFFLFEFDNEDFAQYGDRIRNQECAILLRADFRPEGAASEPDFWELLQQAGLIHSEDGAELFYETVPADILGQTTQEELDKWNGMIYHSAILLEDGSAIYKLNRAQYAQALRETVDRLESICQRTPQSFAYTDKIQSITHNEDFTEFIVTVKDGMNFDVEELRDSIEIFARRYSLYTTGRMGGPITLRYQDTSGKPTERAEPSYQLRVGGEGVSSVTVYRGSTPYYGYGLALDREFSVGDVCSLPCLDGLRSLNNVQVLATDADGHTIWQHQFTGEEAFPWAEGGWQIEWMLSGDEKSLLYEFLSPVQVEYRDNTVIDKVTKGEQMTLEALLTTDHWTAQPIPEGVTGPGELRRGLILRQENGIFMVISYDTDALNIFTPNGNCIGRYTGSYTGEQMVDMLWDWMLEQNHKGSATITDAALTQHAPQGKLSVLMHPTTAIQIDGMGAYSPPDQEAWVTAWNTVLASGASIPWNMSASDYYGLMISYQGTYLEVHRDDQWLHLHKMGSETCYSAEASAPLIRLLEPIMADFRHAPVQPADLHGIRYANLVLDGLQYAIFAGDPKLQTLERILTSAKPMGFMGACWFTSQLTLTTEDGRPYTISVATDSCGAYLSDGVCYEFPGDNTELYQLFGITLTEE